ncbi:MAG: sulfatase-like hydrolase/transferase [Phycisphaerae bacterium]|nr:sulfatase-like hydrolase/transferase [Phycisphaerae bacterium]MCZ2398496.1 sulfatase-like hydrolase/transferase [Phycisphaerae bacterium]
MSKTLPNILIVVIDCARSDAWLGPGRRVQTPSVDRLAAEGFSLPVTITEKACTTPAFTTLLSGQYSPRHGVHQVWGYRVRETTPLLTHDLAAAGYNTYAETSGPLLAETGLDRAFARFEYRAPCDYLHTAWGERFVQRLKSGHYRAPWLIMLHTWELHGPRQVLPAFDAPAFGRDPYERAVSSLDAQLRRVFDAAGDDALIVLTGDHGEKTAREVYREDSAVAYARRRLGLDRVEGMPPHHLAQWAGPSVLHQFCEEFNAELRDTRVDQIGQRGESWWTRACDRLRLLYVTPWVYLHDLLALGKPLRLTEMLRRRGLLDRGRSRAALERMRRAVGHDVRRDMHRRMWLNSYKNNMIEGHMVGVYDFLVRVPLVLRWRGRLPAGRVSERMVRQPDILPTVIDLVLGREPSQSGDLDGRSVRGLLDGGALAEAPAFVSVTGIPAELEVHGVRTETHKYTYGPYNPELPEELYDLRHDPGETLNVAGREPELCLHLRETAQRLASTAGQAEAAEPALAAADRAHVERHLRELGYIE